jgi:hypothetical protein
MLPLHGAASFVRGFHGTETPLVVRLRAPQSRPSNSSDVALIRDLNEVAEATAGGFSGAIIVGEASNDKLPGSNALQNVMVLPSRFAYLRDGDIIALRGKGGRFRTLYRRNSHHNSFLITERCNHYCLMCSQPPRDVNDGWILDEITAALPLIDPETRSLGFTGGEPLLDWRGFISLLQDWRERLPNTAIHVLSNGRAFAESKVVAAWRVCITQT